MWISCSIKIPAGFLVDFQILQLIHMCALFKLFSKYSFIMCMTFWLISPTPVRLARSLCCFLVFWKPFSAGSSSKLYKNIQNFLKSDQYSKRNNVILFWILQLSEIIWHRFYSINDLVSMRNENKEQKLKVVSTISELTMLQDHCN